MLFFILSARILKIDQSAEAVEYTDYFSEKV